MRAGASTRLTRSGIAYWRSTPVPSAAAESPTVVFAHGTGHCKEIWFPVIDRLKESGANYVSCDLPWHGESRKGYEPSPGRRGSELLRPHRADWAGEAPEALLEVIDDISTGGPVVGVGHSMGAAALVNAELRRPTFDALLLAEPVLLPWWTQVHIAVFGTGLSSATAGRRTSWPCRDEALASISRTVGKRWSDDCVGAYVDGCLSTTDDGALELRCDRDDEAHIYLNAGDTDAITNLGEISCPTLVTAGQLSNFPLNVVNATTYYQTMVVSQFKDATFLQVPDSDHNIHLEHPALVADHVRTALAAACAGAAPAARKDAA